MRFSPLCETIKVHYPFWYAHTMRCTQFCIIIIKLLTTRFVYNTDVYICIHQIQSIHTNEEDQKWFYNFLIYDFGMPMVCSGLQFSQDSTNSWNFLDSPYIIILYIRIIIPVEFAISKIIIVLILIGFMVQFEYILWF